MVTRDLLPQDSVQCLRGVGPRLAASLAECGVIRIIDLLLWIPRRYEDRTRSIPVAELTAPRRGVLVRCRVESVRVIRQRRRGYVIVEAVLRDGSGTLDAVWFNRRWLDKRLDQGSELFAFGAVETLRGGRLKLVNPEIETVEEDRATGVVPVYGALGALSAVRVRRLLEQALPSLAALTEPPALQGAADELPTLRDALRELHHPTLPSGVSRLEECIRALNDHASPAHQRLVLDEAMAFYCTVQRSAMARRSSRAPQCRVNDVHRRLARRMLPFSLTTAQKRVAREIAADLQRSYPMARLVQGDVGSGKTIVAALAMLIVVSNGYQAALMAPTELLAEQHFRSLEPLFVRADLHVRLLSSSLPAVEQRSVREGLTTGREQLVVGTHALFQDAVSFARLGLVVVDEQHRFGVQQRQRLVSKGNAPHLLVMTATPIPRTLALTAFGDLDVSVIDELPPGRKPVRTVLRSAEARPKVLRFVAEELARDGRVFVVCPLIESSKEVDARSVEEIAAELEGALPGARIGVLHGRLGREERDRVNDAFRRGEVQILLATTVVEVGVDVPEATVMIVESAQRFGMSQLHQLRGRVGRGRRRSWCIVMVDRGVAPDVLLRLQRFCATNDGFAIAEADLEHRGPGEITGDRQWGPQRFRFVDLLRHHRQLVEARRRVRQLAATHGLDELAQWLSAVHDMERRIDVG